ncbi:NHL repeat containing protein (plasmid) [Sulfobacillus acidophilus DSM 10332]|uniref:NHL repeat containing protein n=1 Tax=Sulfobacillus acidophilus (strain ATCC 700253 / DSM 10332 / NAL) TaxID=679936 RepID=G8U1T2_SULAD|nr:NHL repeat containing protein [Sulfobacillus acidophilus DSM 10332]
MGASALMNVKPVRWLGASAPGGLILPDAKPKRNQLYAPRHVFLDDQYLVVSDSGNHRVLIWRGLPADDHQDADVVLGQPNFETEGPGLLHLPTGTGIWEGRLYVADAWHHRVLVWERVPETINEPPSYALGQPDLQEIRPNCGGAIGPLGFYWPYGIAFVAGWFFVADTGNRRVLGWKGLPEVGQPPNLVLGQPDFYSGLENRGQSAGPNSFRWPHAITGDEHTLYIADAGNHRILGYSPLPDVDGPANLVLGQNTYYETREMPHVPQGAHRLRFPYGVSLAHGILAVADTANNRILLFTGPPRTGVGVPAVEVIGQTNFEDSGENRWKAVGPDTLCWPYGLWLHNHLLAIADSGNNRVMIWRVEESSHDTS